MARTQVRTLQIEDGGVQRSDLNTTTSGSAVVTKVVAGSGITITQTGIDAGTGDATIALTSGVISSAGTFTKVTVDTYGRVTAGQSLAATDIPAGSTSYVQNQTAAAQASTNAWVDGWLGGASLRTFNGANFTGWRAPTALTNNFIFSMPAAYGAAGSYLVDSNSDGSLTWASITGTLLTGLTAGSNTAIVATDSILGALSKLQAQVSAGGGGGGSNTAGHCATMTRASAINALSVSTTNTTFYATDMVPDAGFVITTSSTFECEILQTSSGSLRFILCDASYTTLAYSDTLVNPSTGVLTATIATFASGTSLTLNPGQRYYLGVLSNQNSPFLLGVASSSNTNLTPYPAARFDNIGSMTPPAAFTGGGESLLRLYLRLKV